MTLRAVFCWLICSTALGVAAFAAPLDTVSMEQLPNLQRKEKRLVLVLIGTDWCKYCHAMQHSLKEQTLTKLLEKSYYFVMLNAEEKQAINFNGRIFHYKPNGSQTGTHELAIWLGKDEEGSMTYPSFCILNENSEILFRYNGFLRKKDLHKLLMAYQQRLSLK